MNRAPFFFPELRAGSGELRMGKKSLGQQTSRPSLRFLLEETKFKIQGDGACRS
jgi:hypothetical protein